MPNNLAITVQNFASKYFKQERSYRKQIARQLRTQYVEDIYE